MINSLISIKHPILAKSNLNEVKIRILMKQWLWTGVAAEPKLTVRRGSDSALCRAASDTSSDCCTDSTVVSALQKYQMTSFVENVQLPSHHLAKPPVSQSTCFTTSHLDNHQSQSCCLSFGMVVQVGADQASFWGRCNKKNGTNWCHGVWILPESS